MNKKRIADLIRADIIMMNGGKNRLKSTMIIFFIFSIAVGFFINSAAGMIYAPIIMGVLFVPMIFANEQKYHSEKMYAMIPVDRKEVVRSRFILTIGLYTIVCLIIYTLMLIAMKAALYKKILGGFDAAELYLDKINSAFGAHLNLFGLNNLLFWVSFSMGLSISAGTLRKYFKNGKSISTKIEGRSLREYQKRDFVIFFAVLGSTGTVFPLLYRYSTDYYCAYTGNCTSASVNENNEWNPLLCGGTDSRGILSSLFLHLHTHGI